MTRSARGFASMGVGICAESAPMFFAISLSIMLAEAAALAYIAALNVCLHYPNDYELRDHCLTQLQAAGYTLERAKYHAEMIINRVKRSVGRIA